jgi:hypothetical protein
MNAIQIISVGAAIMLVVVPSGWAGQESVPAREGPVSITALGGVSVGSGETGAAAGFTISVDVTERVSLEARSV